MHCPNLLCHYREPKRQTSQVDRELRDASRSDQHSVSYSPIQRPSPYDRKPKTTKSRDSADDERVFARVKPNDAIASSQRLRLHTTPSMGSGDWLRVCRFSDDGIWRHARNEIGITDHAKTTDTASQPSHASERRHDSETEGRNRLSRAEHREIEAIIDGIGRNARQGTQSVTEHVRSIKDFNERTQQRAESLATASQRTHGRTDSISRTVSNTRKRTTTAHESLERVSEYISANRRSKDRFDRIRDDAGKYNGAAEKFTEHNTAVTEKIDQRIETAREVIQQMTKELEKQSPTRTYSGPSMGR